MDTNFNTIDTEALPPREYNFNYETLICRTDNILKPHFIFCMWFFFVFCTVYTLELIEIWSRKPVIYVMYAFHLFIQVIYIPSKVQTSLIHSFQMVSTLHSKGVYFPSK